MTLRRNGSYIGPRPDGPSELTASGIWDLQTVARQIRVGSWPSPRVGPSEPQLLQVGWIGIPEYLFAEWSPPASLNDGGEVVDYEIQYTNQFGEWTVYDDGSSSSTSANILGFDPNVFYPEYIRVRAISSLPGDWATRLVPERPSSSAPPPSSSSAPPPSSSSAPPPSSSSA